MRGPGINDCKVVRDVGLSTQIKVSNGIVEGLGPDGFGCVDGIWIVALEGIDLKEEGVVLPFVNDDCLEADVDPVVWWEAVV